MQCEPMIGVRDVEKSSGWYCELLGCTSGHGGPDYEMLMDGERLVLQLHPWEAEEHPNLGAPDVSLHGYGVLLYIRMESAEATKTAAQRARDMAADIVEDLHVNPNARQHEIWVRDPDGYVIVVAGPMMSADGKR